MGRIRCISLSFLVAIASATEEDDDYSSTPTGKNIEALTEHYSALPYPRRSRQDDNTINSAQLAQISSKLFGGKFDSVWRRANLRILDAGGGTGDAVLTMARQLDKINKAARIVHLDLSANSQAVASDRADFWGVQYMIEHVTGSLLDDDLMESLGKFDYIQCHGVLHHLLSPQAGLSALKKRLRPGGGMGIMVYGQYGRTGIYDVQNMARLLNFRAAVSEKVQVGALQSLLRALPGPNRLKRSGLWQAVGAEVSNDEGAYDLFLHSRDRAYTVEQLYEWVEGECGLTIASFNTDGFYDPMLWLRDPSPDLVGLVEDLHPMHSRAVAELLHGTLQRHSFYVADTESGGGGGLGAGSLIPEVAATTIPCLTNYNPKRPSFDLGEQFQNFTCDVRRKIGHLSSNLPKKQEVTYRVSMVVQYPWIYGNCVSTFSDIYYEHVVGGGLQRIPLEHFLEGVRSVAKMMVDWDDMVILTEPATSTPLLTNPYTQGKRKKNTKKKPGKKRGAHDLHSEL